VASPATRDRDRLHLRRLRAEVLVAREHRAPEGVRARVRDVAGPALVEALRRAAPAALGELRPGVWLLRRLALTFEIDAGWDAAAIARAWAEALARAVRVALVGADADDDVLWFPDRAALAARFVVDLARGRAWERWWYARFAGLRALPASSGIRTALLDDGQTWEILAALDDDGRATIVAALSRADMRRVLAGLVERGDGTAPPPWPALVTALEAEGGTSADDEIAFAFRLCARVATASAPRAAALVSAALAAAALARLASALAPVRAARVLAAVVRGDLAGVVTELVTEAGVSAAEALAPVVAAAPEVRAALAEVLERRAGTAPAETARAQAPALRDTIFGGTFLLLPLLDELPLEEAVAGWPACAETGAAATLRLVLLAQALGGERAGALFGDPVARDLVGVGPACTPEAVVAWAASLTPRQLRAADAVLGLWQLEVGAVENAHLVCARTPPATGHELVLLDGARGHWLALGRLGRRSTGRARAWLARSIARLPEVGATVYIDQGLGAASDPGAGAPLRPLADAPPALGALIDRLPALGDDLAYLRFPRAWDVPRPLHDLTTRAAQGLLRAFAWRLPGFSQAGLRYLHRNFLDVRASLEEEDDRRVVRLGRAPLHIVLATTGMARATYHTGWSQGPRFELFPAP